MKSQGEDHGLLQEFELSGSSEDVSWGLEEARSLAQRLAQDEPPIRQCGRSRQIWKRVITTVLCISVPIILLLVYSYVARRPDFDTGGQLAIPLQPKINRRREPTTLKFDWHISVGPRAPDGVQKRVYLVNGMAKLSILGRTQ